MHPLPICRTRAVNTEKILQLKSYPSSGIPLNICPVFFHPSEKPPLRSSDQIPVNSMPVYKRNSCSKLPLIDLSGAARMLVRSASKEKGTSKLHTLTNPMSAAFSRKHWRQMLSPYFRMSPALWVQTRLYR